MSQSPFKQAKIPLVTSLVSTVSKDGRANASPKSWWTPVSYEPPILMVSVKIGSDTYQNVMDTGLFALHLPPQELAEPVLHTAKPLPPGENELDDVGFAWEWFEHEKLPTPLPVITGIPVFVCWVMSTYTQGDHQVFDAQVGVAMNFDQEIGIENVLIHRGRNRFVELGPEFEVEPY